MYYDNADECAAFIVNRLSQSNRTKGAQKIKYLDYELTLKDNMSKWWLSKSRASRTPCECTQYPFSHSLVLLGISGHGNVDLCTKKNLIMEALQSLTAGIEKPAEAAGNGGGGKDSDDQDDSDIEIEEDRAIPAIGDTIQIYDDDSAAKWVDVKVFAKTKTLIKFLDEAKGTRAAVINSCIIHACLCGAPNANLARASCPPRCRSDWLRSIGATSPRRSRATPIRHPRRPKTKRSARERRARVFKWQLSLWTPALRNSKRSRRSPIPKRVRLIPVCAWA